MNVWQIVNDQGTFARDQLAVAKVVVEAAIPIDTHDLAVTKPRWNKYEAVAVVADLVGSTQLDAGGQWERSTAAIYDAAVRPMAEIFAAFNADFISIQGDGGFGLFTGDLAAERAVCAAVTVRTFSEHQLVTALQDKWGEKAPDTGFKLGVASSSILGKKVGIPRTDHQAPVWAGRAVNYASKCAQEAGKHGVLVTQPVAKVVRGNDYLFFSCGCKNGNDVHDPGAELWQPTQIQKLHQEGLRLGTAWCPLHGSDFAAAVLEGEQRRQDTKSLRAQETQLQRTRTP